MQPRPSPNAHPSSPITGSTIETPMIGSSRLSARKIKQRCAQGQASETYRWYRFGSAGNPVAPSGLIQFRKRVGGRRNSPRVAWVSYQPVRQRPLSRYPVIAIAPLFANPARSVCRLAGEVEEENFGARSAAQLQHTFVADLGTVACGKALTVQHHTTACDVHVPEMAVGQLETHRFPAIEQRRVQPRILVNLHRSLRTIGRSDQAQHRALVLRAEGLLLVARAHSAHLGFDPDLQEMH